MHNPRLRTWNRHGAYKHPPHSSVHSMQLPRRLGYSTNHQRYETEWVIRLVLHGFGGELRRENPVSLFYRNTVS